MRPCGFASGDGPNNIATIPVTNVATQDIQHYGKTWFLADLSVCKTYLGGMGLVPICDQSVESLIIRRILEFTGRDEVVSHLNILKQVSVRSMAELARLVRSDATCVWISAGSSLGLPLRVPPARGALKPGQIVGIASCSAFNAGYAGISLHEWGEADYEKKIAQFYGGRQVS